jgi:hypothetical protein
MSLFLHCFVLIGLWIDDSFTCTRHYRQVNMVLGNLVRLHWPGLVTLPSGESVPATTWEHYVYRTFGNTHALVWDALRV